MPFDGWSKLTYSKFRTQPELAVTHHRSMASLALSATVKGHHYTFDPRSCTYYNTDSSHQLSVASFTALTQPISHWLLLIICSYRCIQYAYMSDIVIVWDFSCWFCGYRTATPHYCQFGNVVLWEQLLEEGVQCYGMVTLQDTTCVSAIKSPTSAFPFFFMDKPFD